MLSLALCSIWKGNPLGSISLGIKGSMKVLAVVYLLLNLCVATIPRCDSILEVLERTMTQQSWAALIHHGSAPERVPCHDAQSPHEAQLSSHKVCECSLVKFVCVTLDNLNPADFIGFKVESITLITFEMPRWNSIPSRGPEPPYPKA